MEKPNTLNKTFENSTDLDNSPKINFFCDKPVSNSKKTLTPLDVILSLCRAKNLHLSDLASMIGITRQSLNHYIHGRWTIPSMIKIKIAKALGVDSSVIWDLEKKEIKSKDFQFPLTYSNNQGEEK